MDGSKKGGKDQKSIKSSITPDPGYHMGSIKTQLNISMPHRRHCVVSLSKNINPSLELVQPRKARPFITERLLMGRKESNQTNKQKHQYIHC